MTGPQVIAGFIAADDPSLLPTVPEGSIGAAAMTTERELYAQLTSGTGVTANIVEADPTLFNTLNGLNALVTLAGSYLSDGTNFVPHSAIGTNADNVPPVGAESGIAAVHASLLGFDGTNYDRLRVASAANQSAANPVGMLTVAEVANWAQHSEPAVAVQATTTRAAGGAGIRHVCTGISATINAVAAIAAPISLYLRDGATGVGAILQSWRFIVPIGETEKVELSGLKIIGSANTALTLEWGAAPGAGNFENVALTGYSIA